MAEWVFLISLSAILALLYYWGFGHLPKEQWQIMASVPTVKSGGQWKGVNLTWYGFFFASSCAFAVAILIILLGAIAVPLTTTIIATLIVLTTCLAGAKLISRLVEGKRHTFTIGGASFIGMIICPWVLILIKKWAGHWFAFDAPIMGFMAAVCIAYAFGESVGRLACISFGCCYGKPVSKVHPFFRQFFEKLSFTFSGKTKKIAYAQGLEGTKVVPVQGITAVLYGVSGVLGVVLFQKGYHGAAFLETLIVTQLWRIVSEFLRADYRGSNKISAYQIMAVLTVLYGIAVRLIFGVPASSPLITEGLLSLWNPLIIFFIQGLWIAVFLYTGRSSVTGSTVSFHVIRERI